MCTLNPFIYFQINCCPNNNSRHIAELSPYYRYTISGLSVYAHTNSVIEYGLDLHECGFFQLDVLIVPRQFERTNTIYAFSRSAFLCATNRWQQSTIGKPIPRSTHEISHMRIHASKRVRKR